jgi:hypothetical protein
MKQEELYQLINALKDCNDYLEGRMHSPILQSIAKQGADAEVTKYRETLLKDLEDSGLKIER